MKSLKLIGKYFIVLLFAFLIIIFLYSIFKFDKDDDYLEVNDLIVDNLYNIFLKDNYNNITGFYTGSYLTSNNLNYTLGCLITYNYINNNNPFKFEVITDEDNKLFDGKYNLLYKIDKKYFKEVSLNIFKESNLYLQDFKIDKDKSAKASDEYDYIYIYSDNNTLDEDIAYFKGMYSYRIEENGQVIKIIEYFLKCKKSLQVCYDNEGTNEIVNNRVNYTYDFDINIYKDRLTRYVHTFRFIDGVYKYESSDVYSEND